MYRNEEGLRRERLEGGVEGSKGARSRERPWNEAEHRGRQ